jgi:ribonuclease P protein component
MAPSGINRVPGVGRAPARLWRQARLRKHADFETVYGDGRRLFSAHMTLFFLRRESNGARVGFTVPRALGTAVERNRIRRRMREAVRLSLGAAGTGVDVVIHPKKSVLRVDFATLRQEIEQAFARIKSPVASACR